MKKYTKHSAHLVFTYIVIIGLVSVIVTIFSFSDSAKSALWVANTARSQFASVFLSHNFKTASDIQSRYNSQNNFVGYNKVRILIVPGHEPGYGGAEYKDLRERDMTAQLAESLKRILESDPHYQVFTTRDSKEWNPEFSAYFLNNWDSIVEWVKASKAEFSQVTSNGSTTQMIATVSHNDASSDVANRLFGINKWSNERAIDIAIHIHFNDNPRKKTSKPGEYSGIAIYVPGHLYGNSSTTKAIADDLLKRLTKYNPVSDFPAESVGIIDEPELIAIGSSNTVNAASVLIEYGYIYEPQFQDKDVSNLAIQDLAYQTYLGLQDFFAPNSPVTNQAPGTNDIDNSKYGTFLMPYSNTKQFTLSKADELDSFKLQTALMYADVYPPNGKTKNTCPRTIFVGPCTMTALQEFQEKYNISGEKNKVGPKTINTLNNL